MLSPMLGAKLLRDLCSLSYEFSGVARKKFRGVQMTKSNVSAHKATESGGPGVSPPKIFFFNVFKFEQSFRLFF